MYDCIDTECTFYPLNVTIPQLVCIYVIYLNVNSYIFENDHPVAGF